jgi:hypothetical protein
MPGCGILHAGRLYHFRKWSPVHNVRLWSGTDIQRTGTDVRFTPKADIPRRRPHVRFGPEPDYEATTGVFRLLIVILIERATTVIDPVAATAAPAP